MMSRVATGRKADAKLGHTTSRQKRQKDSMRTVERLLLFTRKLKAPRLVHAVFFCVGFLSLVRTTVLFSESWSVVAAERNDNIDLIQLCRKGAASSSSHFRNACLQARAEQAAPIAAKALMRAIKTCFQDFSSAFNTPSRMILLVLFLLSGLAMPVVRTISNLLNMYLTPANIAGIHGLGHLHDDEEDQAPVSSVVVLGGGRESVYQKLRMLPSRRRFRQTTISLTPPEEDEYDGDGGGGGNAEWRTLGLGSP